MNKLKELRKEKGLTQSEIAKFIGITQNSYSYWENDKVKIDNGSIIKLADFFGVSVDYLLGRGEITPEERAAGASETRSVKITPIEDDMLYTFREIGKRFGEQAQRDYITVGENMLKLGKKIGRASCRERV